MNQICGRLSWVYHPDLAMWVAEHAGARYRISRTHDLGHETRYRAEVLTDLGWKHVSLARSEEWAREDCELDLSLRVRDERKEDRR